MQVEDANKLLRADNQLELIGPDPVKVVNGQFYAVVGKKESIQ